MKLRTCHFSHNAVGLLRGGSWSETDELSHFAG